MNNESVHFSIRIKKAQYNELSKVARLCGQPKSTVIHKALETFLKRSRRAVRKTKGRGANTNLQD